MTALFNDLLSTVSSLADSARAPLASYVLPARLHPLMARSDLYESSDESADEADISRRLEVTEDKKPTTDTDSGLDQTVISDGADLIASPGNNDSTAANQRGDKTQSVTPVIVLESKSDAVAFGQLEMFLEYDAKSAVMTAELKKLTEIRQELFDPEHFAHYAIQLRLALLPSKDMRARTARRSLLRPEFNETHTFKKLQEKALNGKSIRLRVYRSLRHRRDQLVAQAVVSCETVKSCNNGQKVQLQVTLESQIKPSNVDLLRVRKEAERANEAKKKAASAKSAPLQTVVMDAVSLAEQQSASDASSLASGSTLSLRAANSNTVPELVLALAYSALTGRLTVTVQKAAKLNASQGKLVPDAYVKIILLHADGSKLNESRTKVRTESAEPVFNETFLFNVPSFRLNDVTLMISAYNNKAKTKKRAVLGWISIGAQNSSADQLSHWNEMKRVAGRPVSRSHNLLVV